MNLEQLETLRRSVMLMLGTIQENPKGSLRIVEALDELEHVITCELKAAVWARYLEAEK